MSRLYQHFNWKQCGFFSQPDLRLTKVPNPRNPEHIAIRTIFDHFLSSGEKTPPSIRLSFDESTLSVFTMKSHSFATLAIACIIASPALAAEFHVSPGGSDAAAGSVAQPF